MTGTVQIPKKTVRLIPPKELESKVVSDTYRQLLVAAYCRVSTNDKEQLTSYEYQKTYYTEKINGEPKWKLAGIFADKGLSGTSTKKREDFNRMIKLCKQHIGIVLEASNNYLITAESNVGNTNRSGIVRRERDEHIRAFIRIPDGFIYR